MEQKLESFNYPDVCGRWYSRAVAEQQLGQLTSKGTLIIDELAADLPPAEPLAAEEQS